MTKAMTVGALPTSSLPYTFHKWLMEAIWGSQDVKPSLITLFKVRQ